MELDEISKEQLARAAISKPTGVLNLLVEASKKLESKKVEPPKHNSRYHK